MKIIIKYQKSNIYKLLYENYTANEHSRSLTVN